MGAFRPDLDPLVIAMAILGGSISLSVISGFLGVFLSERAERVRELRELERKLGADLSRSLYALSARFTPLYVALWSSIGMLVFPLLSATPYLVAKMEALDLWEAFIASLAATYTALALIGVYLARITGENVYISAFRLLLLGLLASMVVLAFKIVVGVALG